MTRPLHETLRAVGQAMLGGTTLGAVFGAAIFYLGPLGFFTAALATGATLITVANALKRRDQRKAKDWI